MRVLHIASRDQRGGAARATARLHVSLLQLGVASRLFVRERFGDDPATIAFAPSGTATRRRDRRQRADEIAREFAAHAAARPAWCERFSDDRSDVGGELLAQLPHVDVTVLHWVSGFLDYGAVLPALARRGPLVWVLHDLNPFAGGCHYDAGCERWTSGCGACPQLGSQAPDDLAAGIWRRKRTLFAALPDGALQVVAPSRWMADCARRGLLGRFPIAEIPSGLDTARFAPRERRQARAALGIADDAFVVLFVATSLDAPRKGLRYLREALAAWPGPRGPLLLTVGHGDAAEPPTGPHRHLGRIEDDDRLAEIYSAADVTVVPSLQDNLPMTALESLACGTPLVGFAAGGIPDLVRPGVTGVLVPPADGRSLAESLGALCRDPARAAAMRPACRRIAAAEFGLETQARRHLDLYRTLRPAVDGPLQRAGDRAAGDFSVVPRAGR